MRACIITRAGEIKVSRQTFSITDDPPPTNAGMRADREASEVYKWKKKRREARRAKTRRGKAKHDEEGRYILLMVISTLHERGREKGKERTREVQFTVYARGNYWVPMGTWMRAARSRRRPRIHIQIELYALPDALIRNHSTAWYLENKPGHRFPARSILVWASALRNCRSLLWLMEILCEKLVKRICFAYVSKRQLCYPVRLRAPRVRSHASMHPIEGFGNRDAVSACLADSLAGLDSISET